MTLSPSGQLNRDYLFDVALGLVSDATVVVQIGHNPDIDAGPEDVWTGGGLYPWMTGSTALEVLSSSADDASAGTGARTITLIGLNASYVEVTQTITLNGVTPVAVPTALFRINQCRLATAGSGQINVGDITIRDSGAGTTRAILPAAFGQLRQCQYTVAAGKTLVIYEVLHTINRPSSTRDAAVAAYVGTPVSSIYRLSLELTVDGQPVVFPLTVPVPIPEKSDFGFRVTSVSATNTEFSSVMFGVLKQTDAL